MPGKIPAAFEPPANQGPLYVLHLRPLRSDVPAANRMRAALKRLLRDHQFQCIDVRELSPEQSGRSCPQSSEATNP